MGPGVEVPAAPEAMWLGERVGFAVTRVCMGDGRGLRPLGVAASWGNPEVSAPSCYLPSSNLGWGPISGHVAREPVRMWGPFEAQGSQSWVSRCSATFGLGQVKRRGQAVGVCRMVIQAGYRGPRSPHTSRTAYRHRLSSELSAPCWGCSLGSQVLGQGVCVCVCTCARVQWFV